MPMTVSSVRTSELQIAYQESGPPHGPSVILLHGWPSDPHDWDGVAPALASGGCRV
jgi:pimeloyl-ACP methyl ester carboxylesterase